MLRYFQSDRPAGPGTTGWVAMPLLCPCPERRDTPERARESTRRPVVIAKE